MCGIVGYIGPRDAVPYLLEGLSRLEYRGYDSAGIATVEDHQLNVVKRAGRLENLARELDDRPAPGHVGIGHTRWATHGPATDTNAHPHLGGDGIVAVVHNGVIENFRALKSRLQSEGYRFRSATDTEVIAHLIAACLEEQKANPTGPEAESAEGPSASRVHPEHRQLIAAVRQAIAQLQGTYGLAVLFRDHPDVIIAARLGSPLVVGVSEGEQFLASDASPLAGYTDQIVYLSDHELAVLTTDGLQVIDRDRGHVPHTVRVLDMVADDVGSTGIRITCSRKSSSSLRPCATRCAGA